jgi:hypothetical protein
VSYFTVGLAIPGTRYDISPPPPGFRKPRKQDHTSPWGWQAPERDMTHNPRGFVSCLAPGLASPRTPTPVNRPDRADFAQRIYGHLDMTQKVEHRLQNKSFAGLVIVGRGPNTGATVLVGREVGHVPWRTALVYLGFVA